MVNKIDVLLNDQNSDKLGERKLLAIVFIFSVKMI